MIEVAVCPPVLADFARPRDFTGANTDSSGSVATTGEPTPFDLLRAINGVPQGERDDQMWRIACSFRHANTDRDLAIQLISEAALKCDPPFPVAKAVAKIHRAYSRYQGGNSESEKPTEAKPMRTASEVLAEHRKRISKPVIWRAIFLAATFNMLLGRPFAGKSSFAAALTLAIHKGNIFLGRECTGSRVGYFALERSGIGVAELFDKWGVADEILYENDIPLAEAVERIEKLITEHHLQFVVIDHLQHAARIQKGNDYADVSNALKPFQEMAARTGACVLALHHQRKPQMGDKSESDEIEALGSEAYRASTDTLLECTRSQGFYYVRGETRGLGNLAKTRVLINFETGEVEMGDVRQEELDAARAAIAQYLTEHPGSHEKDIRNAVRGRGCNARVLTEVLRDTSKFRRDGEGGRKEPYRYFLVLDPYIQATKQEPENGSQVRENKGDLSVQNKNQQRRLNLVPKPFQPPVLVPACSGTPEQTKPQQIQAVSAQNGVPVLTHTQDTPLEQPKQSKQPEQPLPDPGLIRMEMPALPDQCPCGHPRFDHDHEFKCAHCDCTALRRLALDSSDEGEVI